MPCTQMIHIFEYSGKATIIEIEYTGIFSTVMQCFRNHFQVFSDSGIARLFIFHLLIEEKLIFTILFYVVQCLICL